MGNQTELNGFILSGLSNLPVLRLPLFLFFLLIYLLTLVWNLLIIILIVTESRLHVPMYFFLGNLASLDLCFSSVTVPQMLVNVYTKRRHVTTKACITQVFFFIFFAVSEVFLLSVMSYDRYTAICQPLHYMQIMCWRVCVQLAASVWCVGLINSLIHTYYALKLTFCRYGIIDSFFCDLPQLLQLSCSDIYINFQLMLLLSGFLGVVSLMLTFLPYVYIFKVVLQMQIKGQRGKAFSTCTSHLTVVFLFYCSGMFNYFQPRASRYSGAKMMSVLYTVIVPLLNPLVYSLRSQDFRIALPDFLRSFLKQCRQFS